MASKSRTARQAKRERNALRKLRASGLYTGKLDLRKRASAYQKTLLKKFAAVIKGVAKVLYPPDPKSFGKIFQTVKNAVIVPRRKGERLKVSKSTGEILSTRKVRGRQVTARLRRVKQGATIKRPPKGESVHYAIPFNRGGGETEWMRHPSYDALKAFMSEYQRYKGWRKYAVSERMTKKDELNFEDDNDLTYILEEKLGRSIAYNPKGRKRPKLKRSRRK